MKAFAILAAVLPASILASPWGGGSDCCSNTRERQYLIDGCHGTQSASQYCSSVLQSTVTKTACTTVTGPATTTTKTSTVNTVATTTTTSTSTVTKTTTTYSTSTCTPAGTPSSTAATTTSSSSNQKRGASNYPPSWCFQWQCPWSQSEHPTPSITAHCSCHLGGRTPAPTTTTVTTTNSKAGPTVTASTTVTSATSTSTVTVSTTTTTTKTVTSTEIQPYAPTGTYTSPNGGTYDDYQNVDFQRGDISNPSGGNYFASCDSDGTGPDFTYAGSDLGKCYGFNSCQDLCSAINNHDNATTCVAATYNGADASGACYFKSSLQGCGMYNDGRRSGLLDYNGYKYPPPGN